jgi:membrane-associated phospholipid phosphatase
MTRESKFLNAGIVLLIAACAVLTFARGLDFPLLDVMRQVLIVAALGGALYYYGRVRKEEKFVICLSALIQLVAFTTAFTSLTYIVATFSAPLIDGHLATADAALGFHLPSVVAWAKAHPAIDTMLRLAYMTLFVQTALVVIVLGFRCDRRSLQAFLLRLMIAAIIMLVIFGVAPAEGPFSAYGLDPDDSQQRYLDHFHALRSGERTNVSYVEAEGLITFPSFHTTWALLLALAFSHRRRLFVPFAVFNSLIVLSTLTTGWHFLSDVMAGSALAAIGVVVTSWIQGRETKGVSSRLAMIRLGLDGLRARLVRNRT